jgi:hypothetical protein
MSLVRLFMTTTMTEYSEDRHPAAKLHPKAGIK